MQSFQVPIEDIMDLPPIIEEIHLGQNEIVEQNQFQQSEKQSINILIEFNNNNEMITINLNSETSIQELKEIILNKYPDQLLNLDNFNLYYRDEKMDNYLIEYQIENNAVIVVEKEEDKLDCFKDDILIQFVMQSSQFKIQKHVNGASRIRAICEDFHSYLCTTIGDFQFSCRNQVLDLKKTWNDYNIQNNEIITVKHIFKGGCFPYYAPITLADQSQKPINQIQKGDLILCYNYELRNFQSGIVQGTTRTKQKIQLIRIETELSVIDCTADHPFYTESGWKSFSPHPDFQIKNLTLLDKLLYQDHIFIKILSIQKLDKHVYVYNLNLQYPNNYLAFGVLAHNMNIINIVIYKKKVQFEYFPDMPIQQIKVLIFKRMGIPIEIQQLYYFNSLMDDEKSLSYYFQCGKLQEIKLYLYLDKEQQQIKIPNQQVISVDIITKTFRYELLLRNNITLMELKKFLHFFEKKQFIMIDGKQYSSEFDEIYIKQFPKIKQILLLSKEEGGLSISFYQEINSIEISNVSELKKSLYSLRSDFNFDQYLEIKLLQINQNQQKADMDNQYFIQITKRRFTKQFLQKMDKIFKMFI